MTPLPRPLYFAYGSNLWIDQMKRRCPDSKLKGVGILRGWKWIITDRGYANIIPESGEIVYGLVFELSEADEASLDIYENVPVAYEKEHKPVEYPAVPEPPPGELPQALPPHETLLIYIDHLRLTPNAPKKEYIHRINKGIEDGIKAGIPQEYFAKYFRPFIPPPGTEEPSHAHFAAIDLPSRYSTDTTAN